LVFSQEDAVEAILTPFPTKDGVFFLP
jgi:hypothetical protein